MFTIIIIIIIVIIIITSAILLFDFCIFLLIFFFQILDRFSKENCNDFWFARGRMLSNGQNSFYKLNFLHWKENLKNMCNFTSYGWDVGIKIFKLKIFTRRSMMRKRYVVVPGNISKWHRSNQTSVFYQHCTFKHFHKNITQ